MTTNTATHQARILTKTQVGLLRYILPEGWYAAAGILKGKKRQQPLRYQRSIRKDWGRRSQRTATA